MDQGKEKKRQALQGLIDEARDRKSNLTESDDLVGNRKKWIVYAHSELLKIFAADDLAIAGFNNPDYTYTISEYGEGALEFTREQFGRDIQHLRDCILSISMI